MIMWLKGQKILQEASAWLPRPATAEQRPHLVHAIRHEPKLKGQPKARDRACFGCGREGHAQKQCRLKLHPEWNKLPKPFGSSEVGKRLGSLPKPRFELPYRTLTDGSPWDFPTDAKKPSRGGEFLVDMLVTNVTQPMQVKVLPDTGAVSGNYISTEVARRLRALGVVSKSSNKQICSGLGSNDSNYCLGTTQGFDLDLEFADDWHMPTQIQVECLEILLKYDLILGRQAIIDFGIFDKIPSYLSSVIQTEDTLILPKARLLDPERDDDYIAYKDDEFWFQPTEHNLTPSGNAVLPMIEGSTWLREQLRNLCAEYSHLFSTEVRGDTGISRYG